MRPFFRGMNFGFYAPRGFYGSEAALQAVQGMKALNVEWVCLIATVFQKHFAADDQGPDPERSPSDDDLRFMIDHLHAEGLKVQLRPMLEGLDGTQRLHVWFPEDIVIYPDRPVRYASRWFEAMRRRTRRYASLAEETGCEAYGLDSELDRIVHFNQEWKAVVAEAREVYTGHLTSCHTAVADFPRQLANPNHWWYDLDSLGTSFYSPAAREPGADKAAMLRTLATERDRHRKIAGTYGKPYYFGECGCCSTAGATAKPWGWDNPGGYDGGEQARYLDAVLKTFWSEPWWAGLYWWKWDEHNERAQFKDDPRGDKGFTIDGKPAAAVMKTWFL